MTKRRDARGARLAMLLLFASTLVVCQPWACASDLSGPLFGEDLTPVAGTTGDFFQFMVYVTDEESEVLLVEVEYSYGEGETFKSPLTTEGPGSPFHFVTRLPPKPETLHYHFNAQDTAGNWARTTELHVSVSDNDPPEVSYDLSRTSAEPGTIYSFMAEVTDNDEVKSVWVTYWFDSGPKTNLTMTEGHPYVSDVPVPSVGSSVLRYWFEVMDRVGNTHMSSIKTVPVVADMTPPVIGRDSSPDTATTGDDFRFLVEAHDNLGLREVRVRFTVGTSNMTNRSLEGENPFELTVNLPDFDDGYLNYSFLAVDTVGNVNASAWRSVRIRDDDPPHAEAGQTIRVEEGGLVEFDASGSFDNVGIVNYMWVVEHERADENLFGKTPTASFATAGEYRAVLYVTDSAGNTALDTVYIIVSRGSPGDPEYTGVSVRPAAPLWYTLVPVVAAVMASLAWARAHVDWREPSVSELSWPTGPRSRVSRRDGS